MPILDELKKKANGKADSANNIAEAIAQMDFSEGGGGSVTPEEIAESVSAYLDEHLTNPSNPPIDTSLSIAGAAADAKKTGDEISQLKSDLDENVSDLKSALKELTDTNIVLSRTFTDTGTSVNKWFTNLPFVQDKITIVLESVSGVQSDVANKIGVIIQYTDGTTSSINISEIRKPYILEPKKTVSACSVVCNRANETLSSAIKSTWSVLIWEGTNAVDDLNLKVTALDFAIDKKIIFADRLHNYGNASVNWFKIEGVNGFNKLYTAYTSIDGVDLSQDKFLRVAISYTDSTSVEFALTNQNTLYPINIDYRKTINTVYVALSRGSTSATYAYVDMIILGEIDNIPKIVKQNKLFDLSFSKGAYDANGPINSNNRVIAPLFKSDEILTISVDSGYKFGVAQYTDTEYHDYTADTLHTNAVTIKTDKYIGIVLAKNDDSTDISQDDSSAIHISSHYDAGEYTKYGYSGNVINTKRNPVMVSFAELTRTIPDGYGTQGGSIYGKYLVQGYSNTTSNDLPGYIQVFDLETNSLVFGGTVDAHHFGSASFSNEFYDENDPMPLLYVSGLNEHLYAIRVTLTNATIVKDILMPTATCGFYQGVTVDAWNNFIYVFGYTQQSYRDSTNNRIKVTKYDLSNLTTNDGVTTAEMIDQYTIPFIYCYQDFEYYHGKIVIACGFLTSESPSQIIVFNPSTRAIETEISIGPIQTEPEMIGFRNIGDKDVLYFQHHSTKYTVLDFV